MPSHLSSRRRHVALVAILIPVAALAWIPDDVDPGGEHAGPRHMHIPLAIGERLELAAATLSALLTARADAGEPSPLAGARAIAVIVEAEKDDVGIAGHRGRGVLLRRDGQGTWGDPLFVVLADARFEPPPGPARSDLVLRFERTVELAPLVADGWPPRDDPAATGGPAGRRTDTLADLTGAREVTVTIRDEGEFHALDLVSATLEPDVDANHEVYGRGASPRDILDGLPEPPEPVLDLHRSVPGLRRVDR
jgi:lipid-binding SYLF domain-containing protein